MHLSICNTLSTCVFFSQLNINKNCSIVVIESSAVNNTTVTFEVIPTDIIIK